MSRIRADDAPLPDLLPQLLERRKTLQDGEIIEIDAPDPDAGAALFDGEIGPAGRHRSWAGWQRVAEAIGCALATPRIETLGRVIVRLRLLDRRAVAAAESGDPEKYGAASTFARIDKFADPDHLVAFERALGFIKPGAQPRILAVGAHRGDELAMCARLLGPCAALVGLDHSPSAIEQARALHPAPPFRFVCADLRDPIAEGRFDLLLAINVLQSPALDGSAVLKRLVKDHLAPGGGLVIGLPNCHWIGVERRPGGKVRGQIFRDVSAYRRYLNQHRFATLVVGESTVLIAARHLG